MAWLRREKRFENSRENILRDSRPVIADLEQHVTARAEGDAAVLGWLGQIKVARHDQEPLVQADRLNGIIHDLDERLLQFCLVENDRKKVRLQLQGPLHPHVPLRVEQLDRPPQKIV